MKILAVIPTYNESDVIYWVIKYLIDQDIDVHILDNESTDSTLDIVKKFPPSRVFISSFHTNGEFNEQIMGDNIKKIIKSYEKEYDWVARINADEFWESPFQNLSLKEGIELADKRGYNAVGVKQFRFYPMSDEKPHVAGDDVRKYYNYFEKWEGAKYFEPRFHPEHNKIWIINAFKSNSGIFYEDAHKVLPISKIKIFPHLFITRHYPYRNPERTKQRIIQERKNRVSKWNLDNKISYKYLDFEDNETFFFDDMREKLSDKNYKIEQDIRGKKPTPTNLCLWSEFKKPIFTG
jgi:glycosyltransferase involved in cell wall biosynthesis